MYPIWYIFRYKNTEQYKIIQENKPVKPFQRSRRGKETETSSEKIEGGTPSTSPSSPSHRKEHEEDAATYGS
jgi:hypothetical protein